MPIRNFNPFKKAPTAQEIYEQNNRSRTSTDGILHDAGAKGVKPTEIKEIPEYKLSEINDSGIYLPPSPPAKEKSPFFSRTSTSTSHSTHRSALVENEPFNISRESFDSYRRSFDISARSPVSSHTDYPVRQSLDSRRNLNTYSPRPSFQDRDRTSMQQSRDSLEDRFEDVGLNDDPKPQQKKRGLFARFGDNGDIAETPKSGDVKPPSGSNRFLAGITGGRKRGQSGSGNELGNMATTRPDSRNGRRRGQSGAGEELASKPPVKMENKGVEVQAN